MTERLAEIRSACHAEKDILLLCHVAEAAAAALAPWDDEARPLDEPPGEVIRRLDDLWAAIVRCTAGSRPDKEFVSWVLSRQPVMRENILHLNAVAVAAAWLETPPPLDKTFLTEYPRRQDALRAALNRLAEGGEAVVPSGIRWVPSGGESH